MPRSRKRPLRRGAAALSEFLQTETAGGLLLLAATAVAMVWANLLPSYGDFWGTELRVGTLQEDLQHWVNDALMTVFFFVVGLEIKRELVTGELSDPRVAALPLAAAAGGMVVPALVYVALNSGGPAVSGWGIPMATDIAFVVGALALLGRRAPSGLKLFLLTLAIVDDIGAILIIALVYSQGLRWRWLAVAAVALAATFVLRATKLASPLAYVVPGVVVWLSMYESGVHPTIAGVALGLLTPARPVHGRKPLEDLERWLHPVSSFVVVPIFALANAGLVLTGESVRQSIASRVFWGVALGLLVGKTVGIVGASLIAEKLRLGRRPSGVARGHLAGAATLAGIGFTVSLFITGLAFDDRALVDEAKMGVLVGSAVSALAGTIVLSQRARAG